MHLSAYSILSDELSDGSRVLFNGLNGLFDRVSAEVSRVIMEGLAQPAGRDVHQALCRLLAPDEIESLAERGHITSLSPAEEKRVLVAIADATHDAASGFPNVMIVPNLDCNYRCSYCFERPMQNEITSRKRIAISPVKKVVLTPAQVDDIFLALDTIRESAQRFPSEITLYGGEPLDRNNAGIIRHIVEQGMKRGLVFSAITNGHDLLSFTDLLHQDAIRRVQISFDGPESLHNATRIHCGGENSYQILVSNIQELLDRTNVDFHLRCHLNASKIEEFEQLISHFDELGWMNNPRFIVYAHTVYEKKMGKVGTAVTFEQICSKWSRLCETYTNLHLSAPEFHSYMSIVEAMHDQTRARLNGAYCSANVGNYIFCPDDSIYACWESIGKACSRLGTYGGGELHIDKAQRDKWFTRSIATIPECQECAYALVCGGGCAQYAEYNHGTVNHSYCDGFQMTFRAALAKAVADSSLRQ